MTKANLMEALNDVEFDMVEDAETATRQKRTKRWVPWAAAAAMFLCIVAAAVFSLNGKPSFPTESTAPTGKPGGLQPVRLALFKCAPTDDNMIILEKDIATPARMQIRVKNLQGLSGMEASEIREAELQYAEEKFEKYTANHSGYLYGWSEDAVVTMIYESCPCIPIENPDLVASVQVSITGDAYIGNMAPMKDSQTGEIIPGEYFADSADVKNASSSYYAGMPYHGFVLSFHINSEIHSALLKDPTIPLSTIESTITSTITMKDGSKMVSVVDVTVDDSGEVYFTSRCETTV
jgi:hypothetical protein